MKERLAPFLVLLVAWLVSHGTAGAASATFISKIALGESEIAALSTRGDGAGVLIGLDQSFSLIVSSRFATSKSDNVAIFTLRPRTGTARASVRFGVFNDGAPIIVSTSTVNGSGVLSVSNLFQRGCSAFGGCDYIEIITNRTTGGAPGVEVDYVTINGEVVEVTAPTPGPSTWTMMLIGFWLAAVKVKASRQAAVARHRPRRSSTSSA